MNAGNLQLTPEQLANACYVNPQDIARGETPIPIDLYTYQLEYQQQQLLLQELTYLACDPDPAEQIRLGIEAGIYPQDFKIPEGYEFPECPNNPTTSAEEILAAIENGEEYNLDNFETAAGVEVSLDGIIPGLTNTTIQLDSNNSILDAGIITTGVTLATVFAAVFILERVTSLVERIATLRRTWRD